MPLIYRSMLRDGNRPKIGPDKRMLGVKVAGDQYDDITPDSTGNVYPATGGMSVSPAWRELPPHRIPKRLRVICPKAAGNNSTECWRLGSGPFESGTVADRLDLRVDSQTHGLVEPWATPRIIGRLIQKHEPRMIRRVSDDRTGLSDYVGLLIDLHELIATDQGDSDEADALRDRMDSPWQRLSAKQRSLVDGLSADLYSLGSTRAAPAAPLDSATDHEMARAAAEDRWELVLDIVRRNEGRIPVRNVAYLRGVSWAHLGEPVAAIKFLKEAARLQSLAPDEEVWLLTCMIAAEQWAEAVPRARDIARTTADPVSLLQAAEVLFAAATYRGADVESLLSEAMIVAERGLAAAGSASDDDLLKAMRAGALLHMALTYDHRGDRRTAIQACRQALALDPERRTALELFGFLSYDAYPSNQREPFRHRIQREVATSREGNVWPEPLGVS